MEVVDGGQGGQRCPSSFRVEVRAKVEGKEATVTSETISVRCREKVEVGKMVEGE